MKYTILLNSFLTLAAALLPVLLYSQDCLVEKTEIRGIYTGDCKSGKAYGKGKAVGTDIYEGEFKAGLPDGKGTYVWSNGNIYTGKFAKGLKQGMGVLTFKRPNESDSVLEGFWKNDNYAGRYENPYKVHYISRQVTSVDVIYKKDVFNQVTFWVTNTSGSTTSRNGETAKMKVDDIQMAPGHYDRITTNADHGKKTETILYKVSFPARMKVTIGSEMIEVELTEEGSYTIDVQINQ